MELIELSHCCAYHLVLNHISSYLGSSVSHVLLSLVHDTHVASSLLSL